MDLLAKHLRAMDLLGGIEGEEFDEVRICRLAMLHEREDPADDARVAALLDGPAERYLDYIDPVLTQIESGAAPIQQASGQYHVPLASGETAVVRPLRGRQRRLIERLDDATGDWQLIAAMTNLSSEQLDAAPVGDYQSVMTAIGFLFQPLIDRLQRQSSAATESSSPNEAS